MADAAQVYRDAFIAALQPPLDLTVSEWADAERQLTRRSSSEPGQWRTDRVPYLREPMDLLSPRERRIRRVVLIFGSQTGKTEVGLNWLGRTIAMDPAPFLTMFPTESFAKRQIRQRLAPLFTDTPAVAAKSLSSKSRDAANAMFLKEFEGDMLLSIIGGNSGSAAQGMPAQNVWADEVSSMPLEMDDKGDPLENAEARQTNFPDRKGLITSTPGTRGACRITWEFEERSDRRLRHALMPCCGALEVLRWREHMVWDTPDGEVFCQCPACGERVAQHHKTTMLAGGVWRPTAKGDGETAGFHLPGWYAPYGWLSWEKIRDEFLRAKGDPLLLKGWVNKRAADAWEDESLAKVSADGLMARVGGYGHGSCPAGVLAVVMAVDVQDSWLEVSVWGYGRGDEAWRIWHQKIDGDPGQDHVWQQVTTIREIAWPHEAGGTMKAIHCAIDTGGHYTSEGYDYCRRYAKDGVVAIKGASNRNAPVLGKGTKQDVTFRGKIVKNGVTLYMIGTHAIKRTVYSRLKNDEPGAGYIHFDDATTDDYLQGLTCERLQPRYIKGFQVLEWVKPSGARNEPLDLKVYCLAMLELLKRRYNRATMWDQLQAQIVSSVGSKEPAPRRSRSFKVI